MEIYQLRAFVTAARLGNLTRTAEVLHLTQPAITAQIKALEEELGVALFDRRPGRISLTKAGEALLGEADLTRLVRQNARPGDLVVCLGAGSISAWANALPGKLG